MKILHEVEKTILRKKYTQHHQARLILDVALAKQKCFLAEITTDDFKVTLINSAGDNRTLEQVEYPILWDVIQQIGADYMFLKTRRSDGGLCGQRVAYYLELFMTNQSFTVDCFLLDRDAYPNMNRNGKYYVIDGMHRLVAIGLATGMGEQHFPILVYYCTDHRP
jgi:hypothetical protein